MKAQLISLILITSILTEDTKWGVTSADGVSVLNDNNFEDFMAAHKQVMVKFFAPWCGHCKKMAIGYASLARNRDSDPDNEVVIAEVDATESPKTAEKYGIKGYPAMRFFSNGIPVEYTKDRTEKALEAWLETHTKELIEEVTSLDKLKTIEQSKLAVLLVLAKKSNKQLASLNALALNIDNVRFYYTYMDEAQSHLGLDPQSSLVVFRNYDDGTKTLTMEDDISYETMRQFVESVRRPTVLEFNEETSQEIFGNKKTVVFLFTEDKTGPILEAFKKVAKSKKYVLVFSQSGISSGMGKKLGGFLGVTETSLNQVRLMTFEGGELTKYKLENVSEETLTQFLDDFNQGRLSKYLKSEKAVEHDDSAVKTIVGDNFELLVLANDRYVLLEAHAPWCAHCKEMDPVYKELAQKVAGMKNLVIAKYDGTANEHPAFQVKGFPTIKLFKKGKKSEPVEFTGNRNLEGFLSFLEREMGNDWVDVLKVDESL